MVKIEGRANGLIYKTYRRLREKPVTKVTVLVKDK